MVDHNNGSISKAESHWRFWSTAESIQNQNPSVMAVVETAAAVVLYLWLALHVGVLLPLYVAVAIAPLVLLRSEQSIALGLEWFQLLESRGRWRSSPPSIWWLGSVALFFSIAAAILGASKIGEITLVGPLVFSIVLLVTISILLALITVQVLLLARIFLISLIIRIGATLAYLPEGIAALPENFRILILCTSPAQIPELIPGLNATASQFRFFSMPDVVAADQTEDQFIGEILISILTVVLFTPAWFYRITIKSTVWFWWPLAFLGQDLRLAQNPKLLEWKIMGSLWAKSSILVAFASVLTIVIANLLFDGTLFKDNPLITPLGYLFLFDWTFRPWQLCAVVASLLSIVLVYWTNDISGQFRIAETNGDVELLRKAIAHFGWLERISRLRLLFVLAFWILVSVHAWLYFNSQTCDVKLSSQVEEWARTVYGTRFPQTRCF